MKKRLKKVEPIEYNKDGSIKMINLDADAGNADWIRAARLKKAGKLEELKKLHDTPMYELEDDDDSEARED